MSARPAITRIELLRARRRLERVERGASLLRRKREALVRELLRLARPAVDARAAVAQHARNAWPPLLSALSDHGHTGLRAMAWPPREEPVVELRTAQIWGIPVADIVEKPALRRSPAQRALPAGAAGPAVVDAAERFETLTDLLLELAPREMLLRRLGDGLARTSRQVHALEHRVAPTLERTILAVRARLDEREREEHHRLKRFIAGRARR